VSQSSVDDLVEAGREYSAGFVTDVEADTLPPGLSEDVIRFISTRKDEPEWLTEWRLQAYQQWQEMKEPNWPHLHYPPVDFQSISYYSAPKSQTDGPRSLDEVDPELLRTYEKLGIPLHEQAALAGVVPDPDQSSRNVAVDVVFDSVSYSDHLQTKAC
jgi:Fe-S cluster assembly protein SufB